jgi:phospholipase/lecithinase/hemolysin
VKAIVGTRVGMLAMGMAALLYGAMATSGEIATPYSGLVVFGDSLSDTGNAGRFTNGPVWVEVIAERVGTELKPSRAGGTNYAVGGALTDGGLSDVRGQLAAYLETHRGRADARALHVVYAGANNLLMAGCEPNRDSPRRVARRAAAALGAVVDDLAAAGAEHILVPNLPNIGFAPALRALGPTCVTEARRLTEAFNAALEGELREVEAKRSITVRRLDVFALADQVMSDPRSAGFRDVTTPCLRGSCDGALFWDYLHPAAAAHARLAAAALSAIGLPAERARRAPLSLPPSGARHAYARVAREGALPRRRTGGGAAHARRGAAHRHLLPLIRRSRFDPTRHRPCPAARIQPLRRFLVPHISAPAMQGEKRKRHDPGNIHLPDRSRTAARHRRALAVHA